MFLRRGIHEKKQKNNVSFKMQKKRFEDWIQENKKKNLSKQ